MTRQAKKRAKAIARRLVFAEAALKTSENFVPQAITTKLAKLYVVSSSVWSYEIDGMLHRHSDFQELTSWRSMIRFLTLLDRKSLKAFTDNNKLSTRYTLCLALTKQKFLEHYKEKTS